MQCVSYRRGFAIGMQEELYWPQEEEENAMFFIWGTIPIVPENWFGQKVPPRQHEARHRIAAAFEPSPVPAPASTPTLSPNPQYQLPPLLPPSPLNPDPSNPP